MRKFDTIPMQWTITLTGLVIMCLLSCIILGFITTQSQDFRVTVLVDIAVVLAGSSILFFLANTYAKNMKQINKVAADLAAGRIGQHIDITSGGESGNAAKSLNDLRLHLKELTESANRMVMGDLSGEIKPESESDLIGKSFSEMAATIRNYNKDAMVKTQYINSIPSPVMAIDKDFRIQFMNTTGLKPAGRALDQMIGKRCFDIYKNNVCDSPECGCARAMKEDRTVVGDIYSYTGNVPLRSIAAPLKDSEGNIIGAVEYVNEIVKEKLITQGISDIRNAVLEGRLDARVDDTKFGGNYREIVRGVNNILEAIVNPLEEVIRVSDSVAEGDLDKQVTGDYKGDFGKLKNSVNRMTVNLRGLANMANKIADGDLTINIQPLSNKDTLGTAFSKMIVNLSQLIGQVTTNANNLSESSNHLSAAAKQAASATTQIASVSQQIAQGAEEQTNGINGVRDSLGQLAKAMDIVSNSAKQQAESVKSVTRLVKQVTSTANEAANNSQKAASGADHATQIAKTGSEAVERTIEGMNRIYGVVTEVTGKIVKLGQHSDEIGKMISVIDDIAAQTNLLALNAAIEAARAGEQGRGFAVVADEVKKLAERTAKETQEISALVNSVQKGVAESIKAANDGAKYTEQGSKLANEAGTALNQIVDAARTVANQIEEIAASSQEMSAAANEMGKVIEDVNKAAEQNAAAVEQMVSDKEQMADATNNVAGVTEENSAATEEMSASAEEMSAQVEEVVASAQSMAEMAKELKAATIVFKLKGQSDGHGNGNGNGNSYGSDKQTEASPNIWESTQHRQRIKTDKLPKN